MPGNTTLGRGSGGDAALERRCQAVSARSDYRVRSITSLIEEINTARAPLYGALATKAAAVGLSSDWPARFFRPSTRAKDGTPEPSETAPTTPINGAGVQGQTWRPARLRFGEACRLGHLG